MLNKELSSLYSVTAQESCLIKHLKKLSQPNHKMDLRSSHWEIMQVLTNPFSAALVAYLLLQVIQVFLLIFCFANAGQKKKRTGL